VGETAPFLMQTKTPYSNGYHQMGCKPERAKEAGSYFGLLI
jgi:hypothetical protein